MLRMKEMCAASQMIAEMLRCCWEGTLIEIKALKLSFHHEHHVSDPKQDEEKGQGRNDDG